MARSSDNGELLADVRRGSMEMIQRLGAGQNSSERLAYALGGLSAMIGLVEVGAPSAVSKLCGFSGKNPWLLRLLGIRELFSSVAIFALGPRSDTAIWTRVIGDAIDLSALTLGYFLLKPNKMRLTGAVGLVAGITLADIAAARWFSRRAGNLSDDGYVRVKASIFSNRTPEQLYRRWHELEQFPHWMQDLESVIQEGKHSHWKIKTAFGSVQWDAIMTDDIPNQKIAWKTQSDTGISSRGQVTFDVRPDRHGTYIHVLMDYKLPLGDVGCGAGMIVKDLVQAKVKDDLRRFKQVVEIGEIVRSDGSPSGMGKVLRHPARPEASEV